MDSAWISIGWVAVILCMAGTFWNIAKKKVSFVMWTVGAAVLLVKNLVFYDYAQALLFGFYVCTDIYGWFKWRSDEANQK